MELQEQLDLVQVDQIGTDHIEDWGGAGAFVGLWAVDDGNGYRAYFHRQKDAYAFRLMLINARLNELED